jgi:hypothetical protein
MKYFTLLGNSLKEIENGYEKPLEKRNGIMTNVKPAVEYSITAENDPIVSVSFEHKLREMKSGYLGKVSSLITKGRGEIKLSGAWFAEAGGLEQLEEASKNLSQSGIPYFFEGFFDVPINFGDNVKRTSEIMFGFNALNEPPTLYMRQGYDKIFKDEIKKEETKKRFGRVSTGFVALKPNPYATRKIEELCRLLRLDSVTDVFYSRGVPIDSKLLLEFLRKEKAQIDRFESNFSDKKVPDLPEKLEVEYEGESNDVKASFKKQFTDFELKAQVDAFDIPKLSDFCSQFENVFIDCCKDKR